MLSRNATVVGTGFSTTRWSLVLVSAAAGDGDQKAHEALCQLCQIYWRPILAFICHRGYQIADAQDLTQDFFLRVLDGSFLQHADPARGRFRSLLCTSLQHFLGDARDRKRAIKRGGDRQFVRLQEWMTEAPSELSFAAESVQGWPPEKIFDLRWAATVAERALRQLREECETRGRLHVFEALREFITVEDRGKRYAEVAPKLGVSASSVKTLVHRMRLRYRELLRAEVGETLADREEVETELRYLCDILSVAS